ncbi:2OG-Fe(II) oxygenase [Thalassotalea mangrovi]|uniref:2OG-Fe(II) oxygenase n=1 Tax=Thalassotalea mangrovi TaxID=2572245 RepID=A0A4U1B2L3_9GAMM|nr:2OG-Fe(II) oxygenase [Thalassotalea mangrovi]TKB43466.1 2OG-Fe(II) oxygenase [Thalassotalea mangrovi]
MLTKHLAPLDGESDAPLFDKIATDLRRDGFSINANALPWHIAQALLTHSQSMHSQQFETAGIGREENYNVNQAIRSDAICWITGTSFAGSQWLAWCQQLQDHLNQKLFLGLFSFESHYACFQPGAFFKRHYDTFKGDKNRVLSVVAYLNKDWQQSDGGELVLYKDEQDTKGKKIHPEFATLAIFLSEEFPHEVLPANRQRLSVTGWFRVNQFNG